MFPEHSLLFQLDLTAPKQEKASSCFGYNGYYIGYSIGYSSYYIGYSSLDIPFPKHFIQYTTNSKHTMYNKNPVAFQMCTCSQKQLQCGDNLNRQTQSGYKLASLVFTNVATISCFSLKNPENKLWLQPRLQILFSCHGNKKLLCKYFPSRLKVGVTDCQFLRLSVMNLLDKGIILCLQTVT